MYIHTTLRTNYATCAGPTRESDSRVVTAPPAPVSDTGAQKKICNSKQPEDHWDSRPTGRSQKIAVKTRRKCTPTRRHPAAHLHELNRLHNKLHDLWRLARHDLAAEAKTLHTNGHVNTLSKNCKCGTPRPALSGPKSQSCIITGKTTALSLTGQAHIDDQHNRDIDHHNDEEKHETQQNAASPAPPHHNRRDPATAPPTCPFLTEPPIGPASTAQQEGDLHDAAIVV